MVSIDLVIPVYKIHNDLSKVLQSIKDQKIEGHILFSCIVVADGYCNAELLDLMNRYPEFYLITLDENVGRSSARNAGAAFSRSDYIYFLDDDCELVSNDIVNRHCNSLKNGNDASFGSVFLRPASGGFWEEYLMEMAKKKAEATIDNKYISLTSANFVIKRSVFEKIGCFDSNYRFYGFEDRDLIVNMLEGDVVIKYTPDLKVFHSASISLPSVFMKMKEAGQYSAMIFSRNHPEVYKSLAYYYFDARFHPFLLFIPYLLSFILTAPVVKVIDGLLVSQLLPNKISFFIVKLVSSLAFVRGSYDSKSQSKKLCCS